LWLKHLLRLLKKQRLKHLLPKKKLKKLNSNNWPKFLLLPYIRLVRDLVKPLMVLPGLF
jgi:hypothetical protein